MGTNRQQVLDLPTIELIERNAFDSYRQMKSNGSREPVAICPEGDNRLQDDAVSLGQLEEARVLQAM